MLSAPKRCLFMGVGDSPPGRSRVLTSSRDLQSARSVVIRILPVYRLGFLPLLAFVLSPKVGAQASMSELWPNDDGRSWQYEQVYHDWYLGEGVENQVRLYFDGTEVVPGGIEVQSLKIEVIPGSLGAATPGAAKLAAPDEASSMDDPFLRNLWRARPDLRAAITEKLKGESADPGRTPAGYYQILLHEAAYRESSDDIAGYRRDLESTKSWLWLVEELTIGTTFEIQLIPDIADDVWLYGTLAAWEDVQVPAGLFPGCLRVDYRIDYGVGICTDETGQELGGFTSETRGFIHYGPGVGPVDQNEEFIPFMEILWGECPGWEGYVGVAVSSGTLRLAAVQPTPIRQTTWGHLRATFR